MLRLPLFIAFIAAAFIAAVFDITMEEVWLRERERETDSKSDYRE